MKNLTLVIPARKEKESLPQVIDEIKNLDCKKKVILAPDDIDTINAIKNLNVDIIYQFIAILLLKLLYIILNNLNNFLYYEYKTPLY